MKRTLVRSFLGLAIGVFAPLAQAQSNTAARPNVVIIVADDLGNADLGVQGAKDLRTPAVDSLAANGVRFTNGYVSCPVCSPTRAGLLTGRYQQRFGHELNPGPAAAENFGLPLSESTIADAFKSAGYATGLVGKWHLGSKPELQPNRRGFGEFFGFLGGAHAYLAPGAVAGNDADARPLAGIYRNDQVVDEKEYLTDAFGREAVSYIDRNKDKPFLLYLAFNAVHLPAHATQKYLDRFPDLQGQRKIYAAQLSALDDAVGRVLGKLRDEKLEENTLVFFIADNGGPTPNGSNNGVFRATKGTVFEGGVRVPFLVQWKGKLPAGQVREELAASIDIFPTALAAAGIAAPADKKFDGVSLLPAARNAGATTHETLAWRFGPQWAIREGKWKLLQPAPNVGGGEQLFDLSSDPGEKQDVAAANPEVVKSLRAKYAAWNKDNREPLWKNQGQGAGQGAAAQGKGQGQGRRAQRKQQQQQQKQQQQQQEKPAEQK